MYIRIYISSPYIIIISKVMQILVECVMAIVHAVWWIILVFNLVLHVHMKQGMGRLL